MFLPLLCSLYFLKDGPWPLITWLIGYAGPVWLFGVFSPLPIIVAVFFQLFSIFSTIKMNTKRSLIILNSILILWFLSGAVTFYSATRNIGDLGP